MGEVNRVRVIGLLITFLMLNLFNFSSHADSAFPNEIEVDSIAKKGAPSISEVYKLHRAEKKWKICVSLPNPQDQFWWSVSYGLKIAKDKLKVGLMIKDAGGYEFLEKQKQQLGECLAKKPDAVVVGAITATGLNDEIHKIKVTGIPVIDLVNGIDSADVSAHSSISFKSLGHKLATFINEEYPAKPSKKHRLAWFPGAKDAAWASEMDKAFLSTIDKSKFDVVHGGFADLTSEKQRNLLETMNLKSPPEIFVGNAVIAALLVRKMSMISTFRPKIYSSYYTNQIEKYIRDGSILAAPSIAPIQQAIIGIDLAVRVLEKRSYPYQVSPKIQFITKNNLEAMKKQFLTHPRDYRLYLQDSF